MRFVLLQARRPGDPVRHEERLAFAARLDVPLDDIVPFDLLDGRARASAVTRDVDAVLVGGSGEFSIYDDVPWIAPFVDTLGELADQGFPTFASCFGFQGLVVALGGVVDKDEDRAEVGTFEISLTDQAREDPLFRGLPDRFTAQLGHKDHAIHFPAEARHLAASERCAYQALHVGKGPVYATQFHPELTHDDNLARFRRYEALYRRAFGDDEYKAMVDGFQPSPHASGLLRRFRALLEGDLP